MPGRIDEAPTGEDWSLVPHNALQGAVTACYTNASSYEVGMASLDCLSRVCSSWQLAVRTHSLWTRMDDFLYNLILAGCAKARPGYPIHIMLAGMRAAPLDSLQGTMKLWRFALGPGFRLIGVRHSAVHTTSNADTGLRLWPLALSLSQYIYQQRAELITNRRCIELGAGVGALTITCSLLQPSSFHSTEQSRRCRKLIELNAALNRCDPSAIQISRLPFGGNHTDQFLQQLNNEKFQTILGCEIVYEMEVISPLWATARRLLSHEPFSCFVLGYYERSARMTEQLLQQAQESGFVWEVVQVKEIKQQVTRMLGAKAEEAWSSDFLDNWRDDKFFVYTFTWEHNHKSRPWQTSAATGTSPIEKLEEMIRQHNSNAKS